MTGERTYPILPCADLAEAITFYEALGFVRTYRQERPNPYAVVTWRDLTIHLSGITGFDPAQSYASAIVVVPELDEVYETFRRGLRAAYGSVPATGIPRLLRIRRKAGAGTGFTMVDPGGSWLRFYAAKTPEETADASAEERRTGLGRVIDVAARQGDAHGDEEQALLVLDRGLARYPDAPRVELTEARAYRIELLERLGRPAGAT